MNTCPMCDRATFIDEYLCPHCRKDEMTDDYDDAFDSIEWQHYADHVAADLVPALRNAGASILVLNEVAVAGDIKFATELGLAILLNLPLIAVVDSTVELPTKLAGVTDEIIVGNLAAPDMDMAEALSDAVNRVRERIDEGE